jgi:hypothetical protein
VSLPVRISTIRSLIKEISVSAQADKPLVVGGARALVPTLRAKLGVGGGDDPRGAAVYVHVWADDGSDEETLKRARGARVPIVAIVPEEIDDVPYVHASSRPGSARTGRRSPPACRCSGRPWRSG